MHDIFGAIFISAYFSKTDSTVIAWGCLQILANCGNRLC